MLIKKETCRTQQAPVRILNDCEIKTSHGITSEIQLLKGGWYALFSIIPALQFCIIESDYINGFLRWQIAQDTIQNVLWKFQTEMK